MSTLMSSRVRLAAGLLAMPLAVAMSIPAAAAATNAYGGVFAGPVTYADCEPSAPDWVATGQWSLVARKGGMATVAFNIFLNGVHHVAFGGPVPLAPMGSGELAAVEFPTGAGDLTVTVLDDGTMTYSFDEGYVALDGSFSCETLTYHGTVR